MAAENTSRTSPAIAEKPASGLGLRADSNFRPHVVPSWWLEFE
jgi:hypothetical protein